MMNSLARYFTSGFRLVRLFYLSCLLSIASFASAADLLIGGVPLPEDATPAKHSDSPFAGTWYGSWDGRLNTIVIVESVSDNQAKVIYAIAENPGRFERQWKRYDATIDGNEMKIHGQYSPVSLTLSTTGRLRAIFGNNYSFAVLEQAQLADLKHSPNSINWTLGTSQLLTTALKEDGRPIQLETVIYQPAGDGPFPLAIINHGSTGRGNNEAIAKHTWVSPWLADMLNERGWLVAFPQRRGRGKSDGLYNEGIAADRSQGYSCEPDIALAGADRAMEDLRAATQALQARPDIATDKPILLSGISRGGALSIAYAGNYPSETQGVINFVGGWMGDACEQATTINQALFKQGGQLNQPTLWLYGKDDLYYRSAHSQQNFTAFQASGGQGEFMEFTVPGKNNGHWVIAVPSLWQQAVEQYLNTLQ